MSNSPLRENPSSKESCTVWPENPYASPRTPTPALDGLALAAQLEMFGAATVLGPPPAGDDKLAARFAPPPPRPAIELDGEQLEAREAISDFLHGSRQHFSLQGLAGTGKTSLLASLARELTDEAWLLAPTGKAASVLSRKTGAPASTLHKLLYAAVEVEGRVTFTKTREPGSLAGQLALVDEASMVDEPLARDLLETGVRVIASGDPGQLPPVNAPAFFRTPDFTLTQVRRQAEGSAIIRQAHRIRDGLDYVTDGDAFQVITRRAAPDLDWADVVLCWRNDTRLRMNRFMRERRGIAPDASPQAGEPVICLQNDPSGIMNGEVFLVAGYDPDRGIRLDAGPTIRKPWFEWLPGNDDRWRRSETPFALAYAITVHKAQGSEWPHVLVLDEFTGADRARWLYTAVTRAQAALKIVRR